METFLLIGMMLAITTTAIYFIAGIVRVLTDFTYNQLYFGNQYIGKAFLTLIIGVLVIGFMYIGWLLWQPL